MMMQLRAFFCLALFSFIASGFRIQAHSWNTTSPASADERAQNGENCVKRFSNIRLKWPKYPSNLAALLLGDNSAARSQARACDWVGSARSIDPQPRSLLTWPLSKLADVAGGESGARHIWHLLRQGVDPADAWLHSDKALAAASRIGIDSSRRAEIALASPSAKVRLTCEVVSRDGTRKLLLKMQDGSEIECVLIPPLPNSTADDMPSKRSASARSHTTLCISSQVGCRMGCRFCATGRMGLLRNLSAEEILAQAFVARNVVSRTAMPPLTNIVFMGMGEPSDNINELRSALSCLLDSDRFAFGRQKVLVSTVAPKAAAFDALLQPVLPSTSTGSATQEHDVAPALAWSLHAADARLRKQLIPTAVDPPDVLRHALCEALRQRDPRNRRVWIECTLIAGVNDRLEDADALAKFLKPIEVACHDPHRRSNRTGVLVNLIPFNPPSSSANVSILRENSLNLDYKTFRRPSHESMTMFQERLRAYGVWSSVRSSRGDETMSACGQLATESKRRLKRVKNQPSPNRVPQWERLIESGTKGSHRCCLICEGSGRIKTSRKKHLIPCLACNGSGIIPVSFRSVLPSTKPTVAIIGAGISGLALALALQQRNISCSVFERDKSFSERAQGYGLTLQQGSRAIRALGLLKDVAKAGLFSGAHLCFDAISGDLIGTHNAANRSDSRAQDRLASNSDEDLLRRKNIHLPRQSLRALLFRQLHPETVQWGARFLDASIDAPSSSLGVGPESGLTLRLSRQRQQSSSDGAHDARLDSQDEYQETVRASVLVGCDGIRSVVRKALPTDMAPRLQSLEVMVILGFAETDHEDALFADNDKVVEWVDGKSRLYTMPFESGLTMWQLSFPLKDGDARALANKGKLELLAEARVRIERWPDPAARLLNITDACVVTGYPCYDCEVDDVDIIDIAKEDDDALNLRSVSTLIGDAMHPMAPFKGQGANQALLDAIELARALYDSIIGDEAARKNVASMPDIAAIGALQPDADRRLIKRRRHRSRQPLITALREYEQAAFPRQARKVIASRKATEMLHSRFARALSEGHMTRVAAASVAAAAQRVVDNVV